MSELAARRAAALAGVRALSFDLDDTLWHCAPAIHHAEETLFAWLRRETPRVLERHNRASIAEHRARIVAAHPELHGDVGALRRLAIGRLLAEHGYEEARADRAFEVFRRARSEVELYAGVAEMLAALPRRYRLAAITNGNADLDLVGIGHHFELVLAASVERTPKPAPDMFLDCIDRFSIEPRELLHIGDNAHTDVGGARAAGARALWFNQHGERWPEALPPPDLETGSIGELAALLLGADAPRP